MKIPPQRVATKSALCCAGIFAASLCVAAALVAPAGGVYAKCDPPRTNNFPHTYQAQYRSDDSSNYIGGVYSKILNYSPWVDGTDYNDYVTAWSLLGDQFSDCDVAQTGWYEVPGGGRFTLEAWNTKAGSCTNFIEAMFNFEGNPVGSSTYYTVLYDLGTDQFQFFNNGPGDGELENAAFVPFSAVVAGETQTLASQMPGGYSYPPTYYELFQDTSWYVKGSWQALDGHGQITGSPPKGAFSEGKVDPHSYYTYDNACPQ